MRGHRPRLDQSAGRPDAGILCAHTRVGQGSRLPADSCGRITESRRRAAPVPAGRGGVGVTLGTAMAAALFLFVASFVIALSCGSGPCTLRRLIGPPEFRCRPVAAGRVVARRNPFVCGRLIGVSGFASPIRRRCCVPGQTPRTPPEASQRSQATFPACSGVAGRASRRRQPREASVRWPGRVPCPGS
jgi:hypothetical protein